MSKIFHPNTKFLTILEPLIDWRILNIETLRSKLNGRVNYFSFCKSIRKLEEDNLIASYRDPYTKKKYIYLTKSGESEFQLEFDKSKISTDTLVHDIKVVEIAQSFEMLGYIDEIILEHQIQRNNKSLIDYKIIPDAIFKGERNNVEYSMAFELELNRKSKVRLADKIGAYIACDQFDYVLYFLSNESLVKKYYERFKEKFGDKFTKKFMFFGSNNLSVEENKINEIRGIFRGTSYKIQDLFSG